MNCLKIPGFTYYFQTLFHLLKGKGKSFLEVNFLIKSKKDVIVSIRTSNTP